jgi:hypothetical protein
MINNSDLITFKAISSFTNDLTEVFGSKHRPLKLYNHLISKTTFSHEKAIHKHIECFRNFCIANRDCILEKNINKLVENKIIYSERVFIDMNNIFKISQGDRETVSVIFSHLLTISALVDPTGNAKRVLQQNKKTETVNEADFLTNIIEKVEKHVDPNANPMEAVSSIMSSGIFTELISSMGNGIQDGSLDLGKLMGSVQGMMTNMVPPTTVNSGETNNTTENPMNMLSGMMSMLGGLGAASGGNSTQPDLSQMMSSMMSGLNQQVPATPPQTPAQFQTKIQTIEEEKYDDMPALEEDT